MTISLNDDSGEVDNEAVAGLVGGVFLTIPLAPVFSIQPEAILVGKETGVEDEVLMTTFEFEQSYLEVPILLKLGFPVQGHSVRPYLYAGPAIAFELSCEGAIEQPGTDRIEADCSDAVLGASRNPTKSTEVSAVFGAEVRLRCGAALGGSRGALYAGAD